MQVSEILVHRNVYYLFTKSQVKEEKNDFVCQEV